MRQRPAPRQLTAAELIGDPLAAAVRRLVAAQPDGVWCGSYADALSELSARTTEASRRDPAFWPQSTSALSRRINTMADALRQDGIVMNHRRTGLCFAQVPAQAAA